MPLPASVIRASPVSTSACAGATSISRLDRPAALLGLDPADRRSELVGQQLDHESPAANGRPITFGTQRPEGVRSIRRLHVRAERLHRAAQHRRVERHVDARQDPHGALAEPLLEPRDRVRGAGHRVLPSCRVVVDDLDARPRESRSMSAPAGSTTASRYGEAPSASRGTWRLHRAPAAVDELSAAST